MQIEMKKPVHIHIVGAAQSVGCNCDGVQYGPNSIRECGLLERVASMGVVVTDSGNVYNDSTIVCSQNENMHNIEQVTDFSLRLSAKIADVLRNGEMPLVLGGDHSLSIGSVSAALEVFSADDLGVVWVDAHTDINTPEVSPSGNIHGMTIASLLGLGSGKISNICGSSPKLKPENIIYVASRDIDSGEACIIKEYGISVISMKEIIEDGLEAALQHLRLLLRDLNVSNIYMSIDIDVMDPLIAPGTGVAVPNGIYTPILYELLDAIVDTGKVRGVEMVEVNPLLDNKDNRTSLLAVDIISYLMQRVGCLDSKTK